MQKYFVSKHDANPLPPDKIFPPYALTHAKYVGTEIQMPNASLIFLLENALVFNKHNSGAWVGFCFGWVFLFGWVFWGWYFLLLFVWVFLGRGRWLWSFLIKSTILYL